MVRPDEPASAPIAARVLVLRAAKGGVASLDRLGRSGRRRHAPTPAMHMLRPGRRNVGSLRPSHARHAARRSLLEICHATRPVSYKMSLSPEAMA